MAVIDLKDRASERAGMLAKFLEEAREAKRQAVGVRISLTVRDWRRDTYVHVPGVTQLVNIPPSREELEAAATLVEQVGQLVEVCGGFVGAAAAVWAVVESRR